MKRRYCAHVVDNNVTVDGVPGHTLRCPIQVPADDLYCATHEAEHSRCTCEYELGVGALEWSDPSCPVHAALRCRPNGETETSGE